MLREARVRRVIEPMLAGTALDAVPEDDIQYLIDLGLCRMATGQGLTIVNPIPHLSRGPATGAHLHPASLTSPDQPNLAQPRRQPQP